MKEVLKLIIYLAILLILSRTKSSSGLLNIHSDSTFTPKTSHADILV